MSSTEEKGIMENISNYTCNHSTQPQDWMHQMRELALPSSVKAQQCEHAGQEFSSSEKTPAEGRSSCPIGPSTSDNEKFNTQNNKKEASKSVSIPNEQWDQLVASINNLSQLLEGSSPEEESFVVHTGIICDGCDQYPSHIQLRTRAPDGYIRGPRFKCLDCCDYDLCVDCEQRDVTSLQHQSIHRMVKIKVPEGNCQYRFTAWWRKRYPVQVEDHLGDCVDDRNVGPVDEPITPKRCLPSVTSEYHSTCNTDYQRPVESTVNQANCESPSAQLHTDVEVGSSHSISCATSTEDQDIRPLLPRYGESISELATKLEQYEELLRNSNFNYYQLREIVAEHVPKPSNTPPVSASTITDVRGIFVELRSIDYLLSLHLTNNTGETLPGGLCLTLDYTCENGAVVAKDLNTGPHELPNGCEKTLNFNHRGLITSLQPGDKLHLNLYDHERNLLYTYNSYRNRRIIMRSPTLLRELTLEGISSIVADHSSNVNASDWYVVRDLSDDTASLSTALPTTPSIKDDEFDLLSDSEFESL